MKQICPSSMVWRRMAERAASHRYCVLMRSISAPCMTVLASMAVGVAPSCFMPTSSSCVRATMAALETRQEMMSSEPMLLSASLCGTKHRAEITPLPVK